GALGLSLVAGSVAVTAARADDCGSGGARIVRGGDFGGYRYDHRGYRYGYAARWSDRYQHRRFMADRGSGGDRHYGGGRGFQGRDRDGWQRGDNRRGDDRHFRGGDRDRSGFQGGDRDGGRSWNRDRSDFHGGDSRDQDREGDSR